MRTPTPRAADRGWLRAAGLLGVAISLSVAQPAVLVAMPVLVLLTERGARGRGGGAVFAVALVAALAVAWGAQDALWYAERAWALVVAGSFMALSQLVPTWRLSSRTLGAAVLAMGGCAAFFVARPGAWAALDWSVTSGVMASVTTTLDAFAVLREGEAISPVVVTAAYEMAAVQASVFPALLGLASAAALCVARWVVVRVRGEGDGALGPISDFRFNDHLVWVMIGGLVLLLLRAGGSLGRVGANAVAFMGALYALRGAGVVMFATGGFSLFGYLLLALVALVATPAALLGTAILIGIGDTWLDFRARGGAPAA